MDDARKNTKVEPTSPARSLTRDRIVEAALRIMDDEGLDAVSMRRVAREVGVEAMSLYHHVRDKDDLLDGVCASGDARLPLPRRGPALDRRGPRRRPRVAPRAA